MLSMTDKLLNSSIIQPLGVSPKIIRIDIWEYFSHIYTSLLGIDQDTSSTTRRSVRDYVDGLIECQGRLIDAAIQSI